MNADELFRACIGHAIVNVEYRNYCLYFQMSNGTHFQLQADEAEYDYYSCQYLEVKQPVHAFVGDTLTGLELLQGPETDTPQDYHCVTYVRIATSGGVIQCELHTMHNGYGSPAWLEVCVSQVQGRPCATNACLDHKYP